ncbi:hypothetical protein BKA63DRAFT_404107 [Paraphoma chrysanthemicola]|nr:hypothetical protein BKA63DRAFT_404107 [Paraphoma chrysanthemicola]
MVHEPTPSPPLPPTCDDHTCCSVAQARPCVALTSNCPGLGALGPTPVSTNGIAHPGTACRVCLNCLNHEHNAKLALTRATANGNAQSGPNIFLCRRCEFDEMRLYNERLQNPVPAGPGNVPSMAFIQHWPTVAQPRQDLCVCETKVTRPFQLEFTTPFHATENILRTRTKKAIQGRIPVNGPNGHYLVSAAGIADRTASGVGRMCPCGGQPEVQNPATRYMTICMACMGVRINPANLPRRLRNVQRLRTGLRSGGPRTYGPQAMQRRWDWRVNIEQAWNPGDPFIGGR